MCLFSLITNINIPSFYGCFEINNRDGIILENLYNYSGAFNINLNTNIDLLLKVINNIFKMHNKFYFENSNNIIDSMKPLLTINKITYFSELVNNRFDKFMQKKYVEIQRFRIVKKLFKTDKYC